MMGKSSTPEWLRHARDHWVNRGDRRPPFAIEPGPNQESVWDYPRPPAVVKDTRLIEVHADGTLIAQTNSAIRVLETSHPPSFYLPPDSFVVDLAVAGGRSFCEWKGEAEYVAVPGSDAPVGWRYPKPYSEFEPYASYVSFYPAHVHCTVNGETVRPQAGGFYGGWVTNEVLGPFKGEPGTSGW